MSIVQILFGISLLLFGLNGLLHFVPLPEKEGFAHIFLHTLNQAGYLFPTIACIQIFAGVTLVFNRWATLGLLALLPISFNIFTFHLFHDRSALIPAIPIITFNLYFMWVKRAFLKPLFHK